MIREPMPLSIGYDSRPANKIAKLSSAQFTKACAMRRVSPANRQTFHTHAKQAAQIVHDAICLSFHKRRNRSIWMDTVTGNRFTLRTIDGKIDCVSALFPARPDHLDITQAEVPDVTLVGNPRTSDLRDLFAMFDSAYKGVFCIGDRVHVAGYHNDCSITAIRDTSIGIFFMCTPDNPIFPPYTCREARLRKVD